MKKHYITAILEMLEAGKDVADVLPGFKKTLETKGHTRLYAPVLRGVLLVLQSKSVSTLPEVAVSNEDDIQKQKTEIEEELKALYNTTEFETVVDPTLIGGHVITHNNIVLDLCHKTALTNLYRNITK